MKKIQRQILLSLIFCYLQSRGISCMNMKGCNPAAFLRYPFSPGAPRLLQLAGTNPPLEAPLDRPAPRIFPGRLAPLRPGAQHPRHAVQNSPGVGWWTTPPFVSCLAAETAAAAPRSTIWHLFPRPAPAFFGFAATPAPTPPNAASDL